METPVLAKILNLTGTTRVRVDISGSGRLSGTSVAKSSGYDILDKAAVAAVAALKFNPETQACAPVAGSYAVDVEFANN